MNYNYLAQFDDCISYRHENLLSNWASFKKIHSLEQHHSMHDIRVLPTQSVPTPDSESESRGQIALVPNWAILDLYQQFLALPSEPLRHIQTTS